MARVLFVGQQPETVDFTNPMLPGMNAERICGKRFEKLLPLVLCRFSGSPFLVAIRGIADISSGRSKYRN
jgi:hypothetical protein